jgi:hypothetical protein
MSLTVSRVEPTDIGRRAAADVGLNYSLSANAKLVHGLPSSSHELARAYCPPIRHYISSPPAERQERSGRAGHQYEQQY